MKKLLSLFKIKRKVQDAFENIDDLYKWSLGLLLLGWTLTIGNFIWHTYTGSYWWYLCDLACILMNCYSTLSYCRRKYRSYVSWFVRENDIHKEKEFLPEGLRHMLDFGWGNGYVIIPAGHPMWGVAQEDIPVNVHWGLTFGVWVEGKSDPEWHKFEQRDKYSYFVGFDTCHAGDTLENWPKSRVMTEAWNLEKQIIALDQQTWLQREIKFHSDVTERQIRKVATFPNLMKIAIPLMIIATLTCMTIIAIIWKY